MSKTMRKRIVLALVLCGFAAYFVNEMNQRKHKANVLAKETLKEAVEKVSVVQPRHPDAQESIVLPGNIVAWYEAPIYAQVSGYVHKWNKDYGAEVKQGDILAEIDTPMLDAQYQEAKAAAAASEARAQLAELTANRYSAMRQSNAVSEQSIAVKEADSRVAKAEYQAALQNFENYQALTRLTIIKAPYDGVVISREINVGDYVNKEGNLGNSDRKDSLFTVADIHKMRLFVSVPESFGKFLKPGLTADVIVPQFPDRHYKADFLTVAKGFSQSTRTALTEFVIDNDDRSLWPGSYATVNLAVKADAKHLVVPATALVFQEDGMELATVSADNKVHFKSIAVSQIRDSTVDVSRGISSDDKIIDNPSAALLEGDPVEVVTPAPGYNLTKEDSTHAGSAEG